jgi:1-acyl-sn-glycerol-3-phosphate acyltransferase
VLTPIRERFWGYMQHHWSSSLNAGPAVHVTGDPIPRNESAVVISNHQTYADYYLVQALSGPAGMLGRCRYFVKKEVVWQIPFFGWAFWVSPPPSAWPHRRMMGSHADRL